MSQKREQEQLFFRPKQVAEILGVHRMTVWRWERDGKLPPQREIIPGVRGWHRVDLEEILEPESVAS